MEIFIQLVGIIITLPFITLEAVIKIIMFILYFPILLIIAIYFPLIGGEKSLIWIKKWYNYSTKWKNGFITSSLYELWEVD